MALGLGTCAWGAAVATVATAGERSSRVTSLVGLGCSAVGMRFVQGDRSRTTPVGGASWVGFGLAASAGAWTLISTRDDPQGDVPPGPAVGAAVLGAASLTALTIDTRLSARPHLQPTPFGLVGWF